MYVITSKYTHKMWLLQHVFNASFDSLHIIALTEHLALHYIRRSPLTKVNVNSNSEGLKETEFLWPAKGDKGKESSVYYCLPPLLRRLRERICIFQSHL